MPVAQGSVSVIFNDPSVLPRVIGHMRLSRRGEIIGQPLTIRSKGPAEYLSRDIVSKVLNWQDGHNSGMLVLLREGCLAEAKERLQACLS